MDEFHGYYVIDDYSPISLCPSKGVEGELCFLPCVNFGEEKNRFQMADWTNESVMLIGEVPKICAVELALDAQMTQELLSLHQKTKEEKRHSCREALKEAKTRLKKLTENVLSQMEERRKNAILGSPPSDMSGSTTADIVSNNRSYTEQLDSNDKSLISKVRGLVNTVSLKMLKPPTTSVSSNSMSTNWCAHDESDVCDSESDFLNPAEFSSVEDDDLMNDAQLNEDHTNDDPTVSDRFPIEDVEHATEFVCETLGSSGNSLKTSRGISWTTCYTAFLNNLVYLKNCAGVLLLFTTSESSLRSNIDLAAILDRKTRINLSIPVVYKVCSSLDYSTLLGTHAQSQKRAMICPIPLKAGDHVYREFRKKGALKMISHHGIYMGQGRVIHFSGSEASMQGLLSKQNTATIKETFIRRFLNHGGRLRVCPYKVSDPANVVLARAEESLTKQSFAKYNLLKNNCEHFCHYCKTGKIRSKQVEKGSKYAALVGAAVIGLTAVALVKSRHH